MDRHTKAIYKRGALAIVPILAIVGCRVGLRGCVAMNRIDRRHDAEEQNAAESRRRAEAEQAAAAEEASARQAARARRLPAVKPGGDTATIASGQDVPDALAVDATAVAWLDTRSGDVMVATRVEGGVPSAPRAVAKGQKLLQRRHAQALALSGGWVYWLTVTPPTSKASEDDGDGAILRASVTDTSGTAPETVISGIGGASALLVDKDSVYFARGLRVSRAEDGGASGGVYRIKLGPKQKPAKVTQLLFAAERPCALASDDAAIYAVETQKLWRIPRAKGEPKALVSGGDTLGCTVAVDPDDVYWTIPGDDSVMRAKKTDGSGVGVVGFTRTRPTNVVVDKGYAYVLAETSPQALGELGSVFQVALRSERLTPKALVTDRVGLQSVAAFGGFVVFAAYNEAESDGTVASIGEGPSPYKRGN